MKKLIIVAAMVAWGSEATLSTLEKGEVIPPPKKVYIKLTKIPRAPKLFLTPKGWFTRKEWKGKHLKGKKLRRIFKAWKKAYVKQTIKFTIATVDEILEKEEFSKIDRGIFVSQAILESGYGTSRIANEANNWFGHKCYSCKKYLSANNDHPGDKFSKREDIKASFEEHAQLLMRKYYSRINRPNPSRRDWLDALCGCGWQLSTEKSRQFVDEGNYVYATSCYNNGYAQKLFNITKRLKI